MMSFTCPHCGTEKAGFTFANAQGTFGADQVRRWACYVCNVCNKPTIRLYIIVKGFNPDLDEKQQMGVMAQQVWPEPPRAEAPDDTPEIPARIFAQAMRALQRQDFDAAGAMARKSMETALKMVAPESKAKNIYERIEELPPEKGLTPTMKEWAHELRSLGADAAHDLDPFSEKEAGTTVGFARVLFEYLFTMPAQVAASRAGRDQ